MAVRVVVVDDSALMRKLVSEMLESNPEIQLVGKARDGVEALEVVNQVKPDVITLDVEMPNMNGTETLKALSSIGHFPVVMLSSLTHSGAEVTMQCLALGAFDFVPKPSGSISLDIEKVQAELIGKVLAAAGAKSTPRSHVPPRRVVLDVARKTTPHEKILVIGSSTGGPRALLALVPSLPENLHAPVVIVQHMPENFTKPLAERLDQNSRLRVKEVESGDRLQPGTVLVAKGGYHLEFDRSGCAVLTQAAPLHGVRPSVDVTMASMIPNFAKDIVGVILTGMGKDGAQGMRAIRQAGGHTIVQDEATCTVYGMPRAVVEVNGADEILPLNEIPRAIVEAIDKSSQPRKIAS